MVSTSFASPMRKPSRDPIIACGDRLIDSCPPATTMSASPLAMDCAPSMAALRPDPHTLLMVIAGTISGSPARMAACRAGFWPAPAARAPGRGGVRPAARREHMAHDDFRNLLGRHAGALKHFANHEGAEVRCGDLRQAAAELSDRGACGADDDDIFHEGSPSGVFA